MSTIRVLFLEDNLEHAHRVLAWLAEVKGQTFEVDHAEGIEGALAFLDSFTYDVGLIDLCVAGSRGLETYRGIAERAPELPLVVQSGLEEESLALDALREGAQDYLVKRHMSGPLVVRSLMYALERAQTAKELRESRERYERALEGSRDGIWDWDLVSGTIVFSRRWKAMLGYGADELGSRPEDWFALVHPDDIHRLLRALNDHLDGVTPHLEHAHRARTATGEWRWMLARGLAARDDKGEAVRITGSQSDITERKEAESRLVFLALHDPLTGLPNRALLLDRLAVAMRRSARHDTHRYAVLFIDLDRFKLINDSLGHQVGDQVLVAAAQRIQAGVRPADTIARLGGDEFAVLLEDLDPSQGAIEELATHVADRIHAGLSRTVMAGGHEVQLSGSIGIATGDSNYLAPEDVLRDADIAMYESKSRGRNGHAIFDRRLREEAVHQLDLERGLREALTRGEYLVHYQPIVRLRDNKVVGMEALVRWDHPTQGLLSPSRFIEHAERSGHIEGIGRFVLERACEDLSRLRKVNGARDLQVSVNISARQLRDPELVPHVADLLRVHGLPPRALALELTETAVVESLELARAVLGRLGELGVQLHLDDFGAGYSSLAYLRQLPIDLLKIDRTFISGLGMEARDQAIVRAVLGIAETLRMGVVAEGIETHGQRTHLEALECPLGQGFLFGRPTGLDGFRTFLGSGQRALA